MPPHRSLTGSTALVRSFASITTEHRLEDAASLKRLGRKKKKEKEDKKDKSKDKGKEKPAEAVTVSFDALKLKFDTSSLQFILDLLRGRW